MATRTATLAVKVTGDASGASRALDQVGGGASKFESGISKASKIAAIGGAALVAFGKQAFDAASEAQQAAGAVDAVFGKSSKAIHSFAKQSAESTGLAASEYESMASVFGAQLKNMGVAQKDLAPQTNDLISLGADLAAQFGGSTSDAVAALSSLLRGETDPIERYGVSIKAADVEAKKAAMGLDNLTGAADKQATTQATLALLTEQTAAAQGAFGREANTAAGQQARANAKFKDATAALGTALLPIVSKVAEVVAKLSGFISENATAFQVLIGILGPAALAIWAVNAAMAANPATLIAIGVAALVAGIVLLVKNWDKVVAVFKKFWNWLKSNWDKLAIVILGPFGVAIYAIKRNWKTITKVFAAFGRFAARIFRTVKDVAVSVFRAIRDVVLRTIDAAKRVVNWIRDRFIGVFRSARDVVRTIFDAIRDVIVRTIDALVRVVTAVRDRFLGAFRTARDVVRTIFEAIRDVIVRTIDAIVRVVTAIRDRLNAAWRTARDVARGVFDAIRGFIQWPIDKLTDLVGYINDRVMPIWDAIKDAVQSAFGAMLAPIQAVIDKLESAIGWAQDAVDAIGDFLGAKTKGTAALDRTATGRTAPASTGGVPARHAAPAIASHGVGSRSTLSAGRGGVVVNVSGALDPDAVARQIERILTARNRRTSGVRIIGRPLV